MQTIVRAGHFEICYDVNYVYTVYCMGCSHETLLNAPATISTICQYL